MSVSGPHKKWNHQTSSPAFLPFILTRSMEEKIRQFRDAVLKKHFSNDGPDKKTYKEAFDLLLEVCRV